MSSVTGYTFFSDIFCPDCTKSSYRYGDLVAVCEEPADEHGIPFELYEYDGTPVNVLFDDNESDSQESCAGCGEEIETQIVCYCDNPDFGECQAREGEHYD